MMKLFDDAWKDVYGRIDNVNVFRQNMMTLAFDGSEDYLASRKLMDHGGDEMIVFREELLKTKSCTSLKVLRMKIIPPEGVKRKDHDEGHDEEHDEGMELFDGEEFEEDEMESNNADESESETEEDAAISNESENEEDAANGMRNDEKWWYSNSSNECGG